MEIRNFSTFKIANTEANRQHCKYLNLAYTATPSGKMIVVAIPQNAYLFASSVSALKKALGF